MVKTSPIPDHHGEWKFLIVRIFDEFCVFQLKEVGLLLGLMCKYSCEECTLILYDDNNFTSIDVAKGTILDNMNIIKQLVGRLFLTCYIAS